ncbi:MAG: hypothetical protein IPJ89_03385 [Candidatus Iainarchaeum archaeon]|uniref:Uncharacterized protein n=1 Tax=Candidatus Iainarchaeum sp. TaxID=3101447 RepID=A0A7T9DIW5_9ARCH|nr:MAG: hypothetical protein IPJ89_03385 [Candidatus Diapherotrites archaeon]
MRPKNSPKRLRFPSRGGIQNARRRPSDEPTLDGFTRALQRRTRAAKEMGFFDGEAVGFADAIPLRGKHLRLPVHARDALPERIMNTKDGFGSATLRKYWSARIQRFLRQHPSAEKLKHYSLPRATALLVDTIRFFGKSYGIATAQRIALNYLSGSDITSPRAPPFLEAERSQYRPFFVQFDSHIDSRRGKHLDVQRLRSEARDAGYRIVKRKPSSGKT